MKAVIKWTVFLFAVAALIAAGVGLFLLGSRDEAVTGADTRRLVPVTAMRLVPGRFRSTGDYSARLAAARDVTVTSMVSGTIKEDFVSEGEDVTEGQPLYRIDEDAYRFAMEQAKASLDLAEEHLRKTRNISRPELIRRLEALVAQRESSLEKAASDARRYEELYRQGAIPLSRKEDADLHLVASRSQLEIARKNLEEASVGAREEDRAAAEAGVRQAEAAWRIARDRWEETLVRSPLAGTIAAKNVFFGDTVQPGTAMAEVVDLSSFKIEVGVSGADVGYLAEGDTVTVTVREAEDSMPAVVRDVGVKASGRTGSFPVLLKMENPDRDGSPRRFRAGMDVTISFTRTEIDRALVIPLTALLRETDRNYVFIVSGDVARRRGVTVSAQSGGEAAVASGLDEGDLVIVVGQQQLRDGDRVELTVEE